MGPPAAHRADVCRGSAQRDLQDGNVELRVVRQHADDGSLVGRDARQVPVRPVGHHLVGVGEPCRGSEDRPGVADGNPVAEELADPGHGGREVDGTEHQHPRRRRERLHEHGQLVHPALAVRAVVPHAGQALRQHSPGVVVDRLVEPVARSERAGRMRLAVGGPDHPPGAQLSRALDHRGDGDRLTGPHGLADVAELRVALPADRLDEDVDDAAAGQADAERGVVTDAIALQHRLAAGDHLAGQLVDGALDAAA